MRELFWLAPSLLLIAAPAAAEVPAGALDRIEAGIKACQAGQAG